MEKWSGGSYRKTQRKSTGGCRENVYKAPKVRETV